MRRNDHGGEIFRSARELNLAAGEIVDFSASINPLGMPAGVRRAAVEAIAEAVHYPEADAASLLASLAAHHRLPAECLLTGNGSTELLYLLPRVLRPRRALVVTPAFSEYERSLQQAGAVIERFPLEPEDGFRFDPRALLSRVGPGIDLVLLANPGNPSGAGLLPEAVAEVAHAMRGRAVLAVDEAFIDFCPHLSVLDQVPAHPNLYVFRSLTKFYAIPGLRAGYLAGPSAGISALAAACPPWSLSVPALAAARACLAEEEFRHRTLQLVPALRQEMAAALTRLGLTVFPSEANYLLCRLPEGGSAAALAPALRQRGLLVRDCSGFHPLDGRYLRVAVRSAEENARLLEELPGVLATGR